MIERIEDLNFGVTIINENRSDDKLTFSKSLGQIIFKNIKKFGMFSRTRAGFKWTQWFDNEVKWRDLPENRRPAEI
ncbi:hypothetical protein [Sodalis sp. dw_96]|uniref:hypothetical protein n=1 Tax=Sodalis sp. dw_96 TaxID=2719794 RepID=UPI001BD2DE4D|nr:hypothetical protein [Sodalis sp. dw_96]